MSQVITIPYQPRDYQLRLHELMWKFRYGVAVCHRRFGKSVMCINELVRRALSTVKDDYRGSYIGPTYKQTKAIVWDYLKKYADPVPGREFNESELRVDFPNGARLRLFGGDNPDALRGVYHDDVVMDEFDDTKHNLWTQVVYPATVDREGNAYFIGTFLRSDGPLGHIFDQAEKMDDDWFAVIYRASQTKIINEDELRIARHNMTEEEFEREFECNRTTAVKGAYYAKQLLQAERDGRMTDVELDSSLRVITGWDIGFDTTAVWFAQPSGNQLRVIDYFETIGEDITEIAPRILNRPYTYAAHYFPHDMAHRAGWAVGPDVTTESHETRLQVAKKLGLTPAFVVRRRLAQKLMDTHEGINAVRRAFNRLVFDRERCSLGIDRLGAYRPKQDADGNFLKEPEHGPASHGATAFEQMIRGHAGKLVGVQREKPRPNVAWIR